jgi:hypothetical protein
VLTSSHIREVLQDRRKFAELCHCFIQNSAKTHAKEAGEPRFGEYLEAGLGLLLDENLSHIFELTESPIERIFINSLLLNFIKNDPLNLVIQHSVRNAPIK